MNSRTLTEALTFTPAARTIDFANVAGFDFRRLVSVVNQTTGVKIFMPVLGAGYTATASGSLVTFSADTTAMSSGDVLQCQYANADAASVALQTVANSALSSIAALESIQTGQLSGLTSLATAELSAMQAVQVLEGIQTSQLSGISTQLTTLQGLQSLATNQLSSLDAKTPTLVSGRQPVDGSGVVQPISASSLPLPSGAATAAKQPALGTAGTPASDVLTVQGAASMTPFLVAGSSAVGSAPVLSPVSVSGVDGSGNKRHLLTNTAGKLQVTPDAVASLGTNADGATLPLALTENGALMVGNAYKKFRDGFVQASPNLTVWDQAWTNQGTGFVNRGGDAAGSAYLRISLDPTRADSEYELTTKTAFRLPSRFIFGVSQTHRFLGHELEVSLVGVDGAGAIEVNSAFADVAISETVTIATNVATINFASALHGIRGGDRVLLVGNTENRLNVGPVTVTIVTPTQITVPCTLANGTYTAGGVVRWADPAKMARNACGLLFENATVTNATYFTRRNGSSGRLLTATTATTTGTQSNTSPYSDAFNSAGAHELIGSMQEFMFISKAADGIAAASGQGRWSQGIPDEEKEYKLRIRAKALSNVTRPIGKIVTATKLAASTTTNIVTSAAHGLAVGSWVAISGVRDIANFPNTAAAAVLSIVSSTEFTIAMAGTTISNSVGGSAILVEGSTVLSGLTGLSVQSIQRTNNILTVTVNTTATGALPGEYWEMHGCNATSMGLYDGPYKMLRMTGSTYEVESVGSNFSSINCGGTFFRRTEHRLHFVQELEYTRHVVELFNQHGSLDASRALAVAPVSLPTLGAITNGMLSFPVLAADIASAAIATATTAAVTQAQGISYSVAIGITAAASLVMDVGIEESDDVGVNWVRVYDFPRTSTSAAQVIRSPVLRSIGTRIRYVTTLISGTGTRVLNRFQMSQPAGVFRQRYDRTITLTSLSSVTATLEADDCDKAELVFNVGAITTTAPVIQMQKSEDYGQSWVDIGSTLTAVASSTVSQTITAGVGRQLRAIVKTAGVGVTAGYVMLKAWR